VSFIAVAARFFIPFSILMLSVAGRLESAAEQPDRVRVVWDDGHRSEVSERELKQYIVSSKRPEYPIAARRSRLEGAGIFVLNIDKKTGAVTGVDIERSTGSKLLDGYATSAFNTWRFKPGTFLRVRMPSAFIITRPVNPWVF
jgi:TonB family protein